jgi:hypothetical protein
MKIETIFSWKLSGGNGIRRNEIKKREHEEEN